MPARFFSLRRLFSRQPQRSRRARRARRLRLESLESRQLLAATDLASLTGVVFKDIDGNGLSPGEEVAGADVQLYLDNGDGVFNGADGAPLQTALSGADGVYRFDDLTVGDYFVSQPEQTVGGVHLKGGLSDLIEIIASDVAGVSGMYIDTFDATQQSASAFGSSPSTRTDASAAAAIEALGGERDLFVSLQSAGGRIEVVANESTVGQIDFGSLGSSTGVRQVTWDGADGDGQTLDPTGLGGVDLTQGGLSTAIDLNIGSDLGGMARLVVYSDANHWSETTFAIAANGGGPTESLVLKFDEDFTGNADFTDVGAIVFEIDGGANFDASVNSIGTIGPTVFQQDFDNLEIADLWVTKSVDVVAPNVGDLATYTITVHNDGPDPATGVSVTDLLPGGLSVVESNPSQGAYFAGLWEVGSLDTGASATLLLTTRIHSAGEKTNVAEVSTSEQLDPDSTPGNQIASEDDQASATFTPQQIDLWLMKEVDNDAPQVGQEISFTITVFNDGPSTATGVEVKDQLPAGLTLMDSSASQGAYDAGSGIWTVGSLSEGGQQSLTLTARADESGSKTNVAEVWSAGQHDVDSTPGNHLPQEDDQASVSVRPIDVVDLQIDKVDEPDPVQPGENLIYTLFVSNNGPSTATGVLVEDTLPDGVSVTSVVPSQGSSLGVQGGVLSVDLGTLQAGQTETIQVTVEVAADILGEIENEAVVSAEQLELDPTNNVDREVTTVEPLPAAVTGMVFYDRDEDGFLGFGETGIGNVRVRLTGVDYLGNSVSLTQSTDSDGSYWFDVLPGSYQVSETQPSGYRDGVETLGLGQAGVILANDVFGELEVASGQLLGSYDFPELLSHCTVLSKRCFLSSSDHGP